MKHTGLIVLASSLSLVGALALGGCGKKDDGKEGGGGSSGSKCSEKNDVKVTWTDKEMHKPGAFTHTHTLGYISGMTWNATTTNKIGYVVLANFDVKMGPYMIEMPKKEGEQAILIKFKTKGVPTTMETQKSEYAKLKLVKGEQKPSWTPTDPGFELTYFVGGQNSGPGLTNSKAKGIATLTEIDGALCGSIDYTTPNGSTLKGTFNAKISKDLWAK